jgi:hypothetical protein
VSGHSPLSLLRPIFFDLLLADKLDALLPRILAVLRIAEFEAPTAVFAPVPAHVLARSTTLCTELRDSLACHLFGATQLCSLRVRLSLAYFCWVRATVVRGRTH